MGRFSKIKKTKAAGLGGSYFPRVSADYLVQIQTTGSIDTPNGEALICECNILQAPEHIEGAAAKGSVCTYMRLYSQGVTGYIEGIAKRLVMHFEEIEDEDEVTEEMMEYYFGDKREDVSEDGIILRLTTTPGTSKKGADVTKHAFRAPSAADLEFAGEALGF